MTAEKLKELLESGAITQEEFDEMIKNIKDPEPPKPNPDNDPDPDLEKDEDETLKRLRQAEIDRALANERKEKAELKKKIERMEKKYLSEEDRRIKEIEEERERFEKERKEFELEKRKTYALKAMKKADADDSEEATLLIEKLVVACEDETEIDDMIALLKTIFEKRDKKTVNKIYKENGYTPKNSENLNGGKNPYIDGNLTEQMALEINNPDLAAKLKAAAGVK